MFLINPSMLILQNPNMWDKCFLKTDAWMETVSIEKKLSLKDSIQSPKVVS